MLLSAPRAFIYLHIIFFFVHFASSIKCGWKLRIAPGNLWLCCNFNYLRTVFFSLSFFFIHVGLSVTFGFSYPLAAPICKWLMDLHKSANRQRSIACIYCQRLPAGIAFYFKIYNVVKLKQFDRFVVLYSVASSGKWKRLDISRCMREYYYILI